MRKALRRRHKFNAKKTCVDGKMFDSRGEANRWCVLRLMEKAGEISDLHRQVRFPLKVHGILITTYVADFVYRDVDGKQVIEDYKGFRTPEYRLKARLFRAITGTEIRETGAKSRARSG